MATPTSTPQPEFAVSPGFVGTLAGNIGYVSDANSKWVYALNADTGALAQAFFVRGGPSGCLLSKDARKAYVSTGKSLLIADTQSGTVLESQPILPVSTTNPVPVVFCRRIAPPANFAAAPGDASVTFTWSACTDPSAFGYVLYGAQSAGGPYVALFPALTGSGQPILSVGKTRLVFTPASWAPLANDRHYWFRIAVVDRSGVVGNMSDPPVDVIPNPVTPVPHCFE
jgi:hypothetical protein